MSPLPPYRPDARTTQPHYGSLKSFMNDTPQDVRMTYTFHSSAKRDIEAPLLSG
ncbi:hypothetical protein DSLASN_47680 [Desulfoluna limicola]|uniref:Uncharacterized protein n=1 Tax=Desulfoluna limicola TaxID=2810562 RepID=A0ABM7PNL5_9BACT|nr:hypothetical protein DSLASN_47680 [Desulfoluna limicola]